MARERRSTPSRYARVRFLEAGLTVLAEDGFGALKLAAVCARADATTGSFYHAFDNWAEFTSALIAYWREEKSQRPIAEARKVTDPVERLTALMDVGLTLPHDSERAIRVWAAQDPEVRKHQEEVDLERRDFIAETYREALGDDFAAEEYATISMYLLVGYESGTLRSYEALDLGFRMFLQSAIGPLGELGDAARTPPPPPDH
ncbi:putative transcriptional regulator, TetR family [Gordonia polyisoprenivorans VH2]|uniref:Putative transcriptional regulator, TetR family n=1 Tax=Gordonia polyisoprenivorans (strain DSM 44266 / VH2) TaxID=1112204 RepID=H6MXK6_GORPV|nr:TetR family transcriptional regulator [Gordonia polyisoprenivorans]AFA75531.1 putative transcriptional regulator, TetR family [Gordonia polyisoprenivorans VH2]